MDRDQLNQHIQGHDKGNSWWLHDVKGIPVARVCDKCEDAIKARYRPEIFGEGRYEDAVEEQIEDDY
jgi:hypothetical protein